MIRTGFGWRLAAAAAVALAILEVVPDALADTAAGRAAFEKGDFVQAMAEWTSAAERGDPEADFQLGMLNERGDLKQDYKQADRWYQKAAELGHIGAEYRLAWIWGVGGDDFPADPVEAYKWILLASEKGLTTDLEAQLEKLLNRNQQAEAQKRAAAWKQAIAKKLEAAAAAATVVAPAPPSGGAASSGAKSGGAASGGAAAPAIPPARSSSAAPTPAAKSGGCPGWPFPTLPCTEQFPALGGVVGPRPLTLPPPRPPGPN
jgi:hypothetical protein